MGIQKYGKQISWGPFVQGDHLPTGTKFLGTICPWGQEVGDRKSWDQMGSGPNELQPKSVENIVL